MDVKFYKNQWPNENPNRRKASGKYNHEFRILSSYQK